MFQILYSFSTPHPFIILLYTQTTAKLEEVPETNLVYYFPPLHISQPCGSKGACVTQVRATNYAVQGHQDGQVIMKVLTKKWSTGGINDNHSSILARRTPWTT